MFSRRRLIATLAYSCIGTLAALPATAQVSTTGDVDPIPPTSPTALSLVIGNSANGTMTVGGLSGVYSDSGYLGFDSTGTATITGLGATWTNASDLFVGYFGTGILDIQNGGTVSSRSGMIGRNAGSTGTATVTGADSVWTNTSNLLVGDSGTGTLNIENGGGVSNEIGYLGSNTGSTGTATVTGTGSRWDSDFLYIGHNGTGTLNIEDGGVVNNLYSSSLGNNTGSTGIVSVTGVGSKWNNNSDLYVGDLGIGTLDIEQGGLVSFRDGYLGFNTGSTGTATVTGAGSLWNNSGNLYVGFDGTGTLNIEDGGVVSSSTGRIGPRAGSTGTATITGAGSAWTNSSSLSVGDSGTGTLNIEDGGVVSNTTGYLGRNTGSTGTATVTGTGSQWNNSGSLHVGYLSTAQSTLNISDGGQVTSNDISVIGYFFGSTGLVNVEGAGSTWNTGISDLYVGSAGTGTLNILNGGVVNNQLGFIANNIGTGTVTVDGAGSQWNNNGQLILGSGTATLNIQNGGQVLVTGYTNVNASSVINHAGGLLRTTQLNIEGDTSRLNWTGGTIELTDQAFWVDDIAQTFGASFTIDTGETLGATSTTSHRVGDTGAGVLTINGGSATFSGSAFEIAKQLNSSGTVHVQNGGSLTVDQGLQVGVKDSGTLNQSNGAVSVNGGQLILGSDADGIGTYSLSGGTLLANAGFLSGSNGKGIMNQTGGVANITGDLVVGQGSLDESQYNLTDATNTVTGQLRVGVNFGTSGRYTINSGLLEVNTDGTAAGGHAIILGDAGTGSITQHGGTVRVHNGDILLGKTDGQGDGFYNLFGGTLDLQGNDIRIGDAPNRAAFLFADGTLTNVTEIDLGTELFQRGGTLAPGNSPGITTIVGGYFFGGTLEIEIDGTGGAGIDHDQVKVVDGSFGFSDYDGDGTTDGSLELILGFAPELGDSFIILDNDGTDGINSTFVQGANITADFGSQTFGFAIDYTGGTGNDIVLTVDSVVPEPSSLPMMGMGVLFLARRRRRRTG